MKDKTTIPALINMEIAGINLALRCRDSISLQELPQTYKPFLKITNPLEGTISINIDLEFDNIPDIKNMTRLFDTGESWSMFMNGDKYFIALNPPELKGKIVWLANFDRYIEKTTIYCGDLLINTAGGNTKVTNPFQYPLDQILLMYFMSQRKGALIHAAGIDINGRGYIFPGKSGAGKSTLTRQFTFVKNMEFLSDDRVVIRKIDRTFKVFGTPWAGEAGIAENKNFLLYGIFFINQGTENKIKEIKPAEAFERLMPVTSIPWYDKETMTRILDFCEDMISNIPAYELQFKPDNEVVDVFEKFVSNQQSGI
jgi:hypothetical protein